MRARRFAVGLAALALLATACGEADVVVASVNGVDIRQSDVLGLKQQDPDSGIKDVDRLEQQADDAGLDRIDDIAMPANNRILVWQKNG